MGGSQPCWPNRCHSVGQLRLAVAAMLTRMPRLSLGQWFSTRGNFVPQETFDKKVSEDIYGCQDWCGMG